MFKKSKKTFLGGKPGKGVQKAIIKKSVKQVNTSKVKSVSQKKQEKVKTPAQKRTQEVAKRAQKFQEFGFTPKQKKTQDPTFEAFPKPITNRQINKHIRNLGKKSK